MKKKIDIKDSLITFGRFCRKFLVGEDWVATAIIVWGIAIVYSFVKHYHANVWYIFPLIILGALAISLLRGENQYLKKPQTKSVNLYHSFGFLCVPMLFVTIFPPIALCITNSYVIANSSLIVLIFFNIVLTVLVALVFCKFYIKRPLGTSVLAAVSSLIIVFYIQDYFLRKYIHANNQSRLIFAISSSIVLIAEVAIILYLHSKDD